MNKSNFNQTGLYPLNTERLQELQTSFSIFNQLGWALGNFSILEGCVNNAGIVSNGFVFANGEVYRFLGGNVQTNVRILKTDVNRAFKDGSIKTVYQDYYITFGNGVGAIPWANFKRPDNLLNLSSRLLPPGTNPQMFTGNPLQLPVGWNLCDGGTYNTITTPDLRKRFIVGYQQNDADYGTVGNIGGAKDVSLNVNQLPAHTHTGSTDNAGEHNHSVPAESDNPGVGVHFRIENNNRARIDGRNAGEHNHNITMDNTGGNEAHENRPPYYTLAFIIYTG